MRFLQLKRDPNNVVKKRLVKSKKNWVVLTSLTLAGGCILVSTPVLNVEASTVTKPSSVQVKNDSDAPIKPVNTPTATPKVSSDTSAKKAVPVVNPVKPNNAEATVKAAPKPVATTDSATATSQPITTSTVKKAVPIENKAQTSTQEIQPIQKSAPATTDQTDIPNKINPRLKFPSIGGNLIPSFKPGTVIGNVVNSITGNKTPDVIDSATTVDKDTPADPMANPANLASGTSNTSHWYISNDKTLHFIDGTLEDNANKKASPWSKDSNNITSASFDGKVVASTHMNNMFSNLPHLEHIDHLENVDFSNTTDISDMLSNDNSLQSADLTQNNFSNVKTVHGLFENDAKLTTVNMKNSTIRLVGDYSNLFKNDTSLKNTDVAKLQLGAARNLSGMFQNDVALKNIDIHTWVISSGTNTGDSTKNEGMFDGTNFSSITLGGFNHFSKNTVLPSNLSNTWQAVGSGSTDDPNGSTIFKIDQLSSTNLPTNLKGTLFAPKPGAVSGTLKIPVTIGTSTKVTPQYVPNITGNVGDTVIVNAPIIQGYTPSSGTVTAKIVDKNTIEVTSGTLHYTGNPIHDAVISIPIAIKNQPQTVSGISGNVGDVIDIPVPEKKSYTTSQTTIQATINADGTVTPKDPKEKIEYTPKLSNTTSMIVPSNQGDIVVHNITGYHVGDQFTVVVPGKKGYNHGQSNTIDATVDINGNITMTDSKEKITYVGDPVSNLTVKVPIFINGKASGSKTFTYTSGKVGDKVELKVDNKTDYTVNQPTISAVVTPDGILELENPQDQIRYTGTVEHGFVSVGNNLGKTIKVPVSGQVGATVSVNTIPTEGGYHTTTKTINVTIGPNNTFTTNDEITYILNDAPTQDVTISTNKGDKISKNISGHKVNEQFTIDTPSEPGYTPDLKQVHAIVDVKGIIHVTDKVTYSPKTVTADIKLNSNHGTQTVPDVSGKVGAQITVKVPPITGYQPNVPTISVTVGTDEKLHFTDKKIIYTGLPAKAQDVIVNSTLGKQAVHIDGTHRVGDSFTVKTPSEQGYTPTKPTVNFTIDPQGNAVTKDTINYQGNPVKANVTINSNYPETIVQQAAGTVGNTINVNVPQKDGYTTDKKQIQATVNPNGTITTKENVKYTGNKVNGSVSVNATINGKPISQQKIVANNVQVGSTIHLTPNPIKGYHLKQKGFVITASVNPHDITTNDTLEYVSDDFDKTIYVNSNLDKQSLHITGKVGDTVYVPIPSHNGYHLDAPTIKVQITPDGIAPIKDIKYLGDTVKNLTLSVPTYKGNVQIKDTKITVDTATVGDEIKFTPQPITGYTPDESVILGTVNAGKKITITTKDAIHYHGNTVNNGQLIVNITLNGNINKTETINIDKTNVGATLTPKPNDIPGYHLDSTNPDLTATVDDHGNIKTTQKLNYIGNSFDKTIEVPSNLGTQKIRVTGKVGDTVNVTIPSPNGYHLDAPTIKVQITPNGVAPIKDIKYLGDTVKNLTLSVPTYKNGKKIDNTLIPVSTATVGDRIKFPLQPITGYTPDENTISGTVGPDKTITTTDAIHYHGNEVDNGKLIVNITLNGTDKQTETIDIDKTNVGATLTPKPNDIPGYHLDSTNPDLTATVDDHGNIKTTQKLNYIGNSFDKTIEVPSNLGPQKIRVTGKVGDTVKVPIPSPNGYHLDAPTIEVPITPNGVDSIKDIKYLGDTVKNLTLSVPTYKGTAQIKDTKITVDTATVGDKIKFTPQPITGYTPDEKVIFGTVKPDRTITTTDAIHYHGNEVDNGKLTVSITLNGNINKTETINIDKTNVGATLTPTPNNIPGYHLDTANPDLTATVDDHGNIKTTQKLNYIGNSFDKTIEVPSNLGPQKIKISGKVGDTVEVPIPGHDGYHLDAPTIEVPITPDGVTTIKDIKYLGDTVKNLTLSVPTYKNGAQVTDTKIPVSTATVGDEIKFTPQPITGYTPDEKVILGTVNAGKKITITTTDAIHYHGNTVNNGKLTVDITLNGTVKQTETIDIGKTNVGATLTPTPNNIPGYHLDTDNPDLTATVDDHGNIKTTQQLNYIGNSVNKTLNVASNLGTQQIKVVGKVGDTLTIPVNVPTGYESNKPTISVTIGTDELPTTNDTLTFTGKKITNANVQISSNKGVQTVAHLSGRVGDTLEVNVPAIDGYTSDKKTIKAIINPDGSIKALEDVVYNQILESSPQPNNKVVLQKVHVDTFSNQLQIPVYEQTTDEYMQLIPNDLVNPGTALLSDEEIQIGDVKYYRIGTNQYIKINQAYPFIPIKLKIKISGKTKKPLYTATGFLVKYRSVISDSIWTVDQIITFHGITYYRIDMNEFVKTSDAIIY